MLESIYAVFILSGTIKGQLLYYNIRIPDITLLSSIFLTLILFKEIIKNKLVFELNVHQKRISIAMFLFYFSIVFSLYYTTSTIYAYEKAYLFVLNLIAFFIPVLYRDFNYKTLFNVFLIILACISVSFVIIFPDILLAKRSVVGDTLKGMYLGVGYMLGIAIIYIKFEKPLMSWWTIPLVFFIGVLLFSGARGPLIFTVFTIFVIYLFGEYKSILKAFSNPKFNLFFFFIISLVVLFFTTNPPSDTFLHSFEHSLSRLAMLFDDNQGESVNERFHLFEFALSHISKEWLLGYGIGSFGWEYVQVEERFYPHNIILEIWFELGVIPVIIFIFICLYLFVLSRKVNNITFNALLIYLLLNVMKSNSLTDLRVLFFIFALILIAATPLNKLMKRENNVNENFTLK